MVFRGLCDASALFAEDFFRKRTLPRPHQSKADVMQEVLYLLNDGVLFVHVRKLASRSPICFAVEVGELQLQTAHERVAHEQVAQPCLVCGQAAAQVKLFAAKFTMIVIDVEGLRKVNSPYAFVNLAALFCFMHAQLCLTCSFAR